jgi:predicted ATPase
MHGATDPVGQLRAYVGGRALLLVLDGADEVLDEPAVLDDLLQHAPQLKILATSRVRLGHEAEWLLPLAGLDLPAGPADLEVAGASQLFLQRARQVGVMLGEEDRVHVARICALVAGLPLGLVLAAARLRGLSCAEIAAGLSRGLDLLGPPPGDAADTPGCDGRHATMRVILASTWRLLTARQRAALERLAVLRDGFGREAALNVAAVALPDLLALVDASLLACDAAGRYALHPLVRRYAAERLAARPDEADEAAGRQAVPVAGVVGRHTVGLYRSRETHEAPVAHPGNARAARGWAAARSRPSRAAAAGR